MKQELFQKPSFSRFLAVLISATLMTILVAILGAPLLRVLRNVFGPLKYWLAGVVMTALLLAAGPATLTLGFLLLSFWVTIGVYQEFEEQGHGNFWTACLSVGLGSLVILLGPYIWAQALGLNLIENLKVSVEEVAKQLLQGKSLSEFGLTAEGIIGQIPSMVIGIEIAALAFALMLDRKFAVLMGLRYERIASQMRLLEFRLPDFMIWLAMVSFLLSFIKVVEPWVSTVALNVFNVMMSLYFFQGLAVLEMSFLVFRVGAILRLLIYLLVVGQLFFLLSPIGLIDYWVDFRQRLKRWKLSEKSQNNEENL